MKGDIELEQYEPRIENRSIVIYAIPKDKKIKPIRMPDGFRDMCDDKHLAIRKVSAEMPELLGLAPEEYEYYIPLGTEVKK